MAARVACRVSTAAQLPLAGLDETVEPFQVAGHQFRSQLSKGSGSKVILDFAQKRRSDLLIH